MRFRAVIGAVLAGSVLLGACGDEDGSAETTAADACAARTLVTPADGANPTSTLPPDDSAVASAVGGFLCAPLQLTSTDGSTMAFDPAVSEADGMCIGTELVDAFGAD